MRLSRISDLQAFVAVVEKASLTSAAHQLGRSLQSVSRSLAAVEQDVGVELIRGPRVVRTRRKPALPTISASRPRLRILKRQSFRFHIAGSSHPGCCGSAVQPDLQRCIWFRRRLRSSSSIPKSKSKSVPTTAMSISSKTTSTLPFISDRCPTRWRRPGALPTSDGFSLPHQAISPNTVGRNVRKIFQSINASFARRGLVRISGHSRLTARSRRSRYPGVFVPMAPVSSTKQQLVALELLLRRFGISGP
jgi:hypothetical protein